jgi:hypothetical protein
VISDLARHSRESRNPPAEECGAATAPLRHKIPAFAGVTKKLQVAAGVGAAFLAASPAVPQPSRGLAALTGLESGRWQLRDLDTGASQSLCLGDKRQFIQVRHAGQCEWTVLRNEGKRAVVTYSCGNGSGRTELRVETGRLAQIDTQGIVGGVPYAARLEARRAGACR